MARKKSVSFSAKPLHVDDGIGVHTSAVGGEFVPAAASALPDAPPVGPAPNLGLLGWTVYGAVYALSFSCVFGSMLVGRLLPGRDIVARGIGDGAQAAKRVVGALEGRREQVDAAFQEAGLRL